MSKYKFLANYRDNYWGSPKRRLVGITVTFILGLLVSFVFYLFDVIDEFSWVSVAGVLVGVAISMVVALFIKYRWPG